MGNVLNETTLKEHRDDLPIKGKRVFPYGIDGADVSMIKVDTEGNQSFIDASALIPKEYDYIALTYTVDNLTGVAYKKGGSGGTTVATLTLTYSGSTLTAIARS